MKPEMSKQQSWLYWTIFGLAITALAITLFSSNFLVFYGSYDRSLLFQGIVEIMFAVWVLLAVSHPRFRPNVRNPLVIGMGLFFLGLLITLPFSADVGQSFWSLRYRLMGFIQYLHYILWFLVLVSTFRTWKEWRLLLYASMGVSAIVALLGLNESLQFGLLTHRTNSTLGNPTHLGGFALLHIFLGLFLVLKETKPKWRQYAIGMTLLNVMSLVLAGSRGPLLGFFVASVVGFFGFLFLSKLSKPAKRIIGITGIVLLLGGIVGGVWMRLHIPEKEVTHLMPQAVTRLVYSDFGENRTQIWDLAVIAIQERPVVGWGLENFSIPFHAHLDPAGKHQDLNELWNNRAHNQMLDVLVATGVVGFSGYAALWVLLWVVLYQQGRAAKHRKEQLAVLMLVVLFLAYGIHLMFLFDVLGPTGVFFLLLAFVGAQKDFEKHHANDRVRPLNLWVGILLALLLLPALYFINVSPAIKSFQTTVGGKTLAKTEDFVLERFQSSLSSGGYLNYQLLLAQLDFVNNGIDKRAEYSDPFKEIIKFVCEELVSHSKERTHDYRYQIASSMAMRDLALIEPGAIDRAIPFAEQVIALAPLRSEGYEELAAIAIKKKEYVQALAYLDEAEKRSQGGKHLLRIYRSRIEAYAGLGDMDKVIDLFQSAADSGDDPEMNPNLALAIAKGLPMEDPDERAVALIQTIYQNASSHPWVIEAMILVEYKTGNTQVALDQIELLAQDYPDLAAQAREELHIE